jgi:hypothetical protein
MRIGHLAGMLALAVGILAVAPAQAQDPQFRFRAYGTAVVDGVFAPAEWDGAAKWNFAANIPPGEGGGTRPATLYVMNDASTLYLGLTVARPDLGSSSFSVVFDNDHDGTLLEQGDESLLLNSSGIPYLYDEYVSRQAPCPPGAVCLGLPDVDTGGTSDVRGKVSNNGATSFYELAQPLDTADDAHDFSLRLGKRVGFQMSLRFCGPTCADTDSPDFGDITITSTSTVPPDTSIVEGPAEGSFSSTLPAVVRFTGSDDAIDASDLLFECRLDDRPFEPCSGPTEELFPIDGRHEFWVRAVDEVGNVDASPAVRSWTVDTKPPSRPRLVGPRAVKKRLVAYRLSATDAVDTPRHLRFRCSLDRKLVKCSSRLVLRLSVGRHVFRAVATDRARNTSRSTTVRIVRAKKEQGPVRPRTR